MNEMGYVLMTSACISCGNIVTYNPMKVPSVRVNGKREPLCRTCADRLNDEFEKRGKERVPIQPDAYEACPEEEMVW